MRPPGASAPKAEWRAWARTLDPVESHIGGQVAAVLRDLLAGIDGLVLGYVALADEMVCPGEPTVLPRLDDDGMMTLHRVEDAIEVHRTGITQPTRHAEAVDPSDLAAVLVPGRVFDGDGYRLGRGGGHYDRLLTDVRTDIPVIGVTCTARVVERLPREQHDLPMTHIATEAGLFSTS